MTHTMVLLFALLIGVVAGLRSMTAPAVVAWGAWLGWLPVAGTWASFMGHWVTVLILTVFLVGELITDQLPSTPARIVPPQFGARILTGGFAGAVIGAGWEHTPTALIAGVLGAVAGTLGGYHLRKLLVEKNGGRDLPVALAEDVLAVGGGFLIVALAMNL
ncbi:DUF4126 domain-containing protein [Nocardia lasii]|uniref:DUF4126 domain-containing protein n=1 Tax=Nocardia lasii TaxID=1616107 RepID=A0ABW1JX20_9NOCA